MSKVTVVLTQGPAVTLPTGAAAYKDTVVTLTDSTGAAQEATLNGTESPAWTAVFDDVPAGAGTVSAQDNDASDAGIGAPVTQAFTVGGGTGTGTTFTPTAGITVTVE